MYTKEIEWGIRCLEEVPDGFKTKKMYGKAVGVDPSNLRHVPNDPKFRAQIILRNKKCATRQCLPAHDYFGMSLTTLKHKKCVKEPLKMTHGGCALSLIIWKYNKCAMKLLKKRCACWGMSLTALKHRKCVRRQAHGSWKVSLITLKHKKCVIRQWRKGRFLYSLSLIGLWHKGNWNYGMIIIMFTMMKGLLSGIKLIKNERLKKP